MPQLDKYIVFSSVFWLVISFFAFYTIVVFHFLPQLYINLSLRQRKIDSIKNLVKFDSGIDKLTKKIYLKTIGKYNSHIIYVLEKVNFFQRVNFFFELEVYKLCYYYPKSSFLSLSIDKSDIIFGFLSTYNENFRDLLFSNFFLEEQSIAYYSNIAERKKIWNEDILNLYAFFVKLNSGDSFFKLQHNKDLLLTPFENTSIKSLI